MKGLHTLLCITKRNESRKDGMHYFLPDSILFKSVFPQSPSIYFQFSIIRGQVCIYKNKEIRKLSSKSAWRSNALFSSDTFSYSQTFRLMRKYMFVYPRIKKYTSRKVTTAREGVMPWSALAHVSFLSFSFWFTITGFLVGREYTHETLRDVKEPWA